MVVVAPPPAHSVQPQVSGAGLHPLSPARSCCSTPVARLGLSPSTLPHLPGTRAQTFACLQWIHVGHYARGNEKAEYVPLHPQSEGGPPGEAKLV